MNSILDGFKGRRLAVIEEEMEKIVLQSLEMATRKFFGTKEMKSWMSSAYKW